MALELDDIARSLLDKAQPADEPVPADKARVHQLLRARLAAGPAASAAGVGAGTKAILVVGTVIAIALGAALLLRPAPFSAPTPDHSIVAASQPTATADVAAVRAAPMAEAAAPRRPLATAAKRQRESPDTPTLPEPAAEPSTQTPVAEPTPCPLDGEIAAVRKARALLNTPVQALAVLDDYDGRCPTGALLPERLTIRAVALCSSGQLTSGRAAAVELQRVAPSAPGLAVVSEKCAGP